jgi:putative oxidoreductase
VGIGLLIVRLVVGLTLAAHGAQKLFGWFGGLGLAATGAFLEQLGFRPGRLQAALAGIVEFGAGLLLAAGFFTPAAAAAALGVMLVAGVSAHGRSGFFLQKGGFEYTLVLGVVALGLAFTGPGRLSLDQALGLSVSGGAWGLGALALGVLGGMVPLFSRRGERSVPSAEHAV